MKAVILNSGLGKRLEELTENKPKCLVELYNGETILERQLRILIKNGIKEIVMTTGPFERKIKKHVSDKFPNLSIKYVKNDYYSETNYIYSIYLAKNEIIDDVLLLHGDLVFSNELIEKIVNYEKNNFGLINKKVDLPEKDFKAKILNDKITKISIDITGNNVYTFMPIYNLKKGKIKLWVDEIEKFVKNKELKVYAENALNNILDEIELNYFEYSNYFCKEIDDKNDLEIINKEVKDFD